MRYLEKMEEFEEIINEDRVLVDFYADWCGPCQMIAEVLEGIQKENEGLKIVKINTDKFNALARKYRVMSIPALKIFERGKIVKEAVGYMGREELLSFINGD